MPNNKQLAELNLAFINGSDIRQPWLPITQTSHTTTAVGVYEFTATTIDEPRLLVFTFHDTDTTIVNSTSALSQQVSPRYAAISPFINTVLTEFEPQNIHYLMTGAGVGAVYAAMATHQFQLSGSVLFHSPGLNEILTAAFPSSTPDLTTIQRFINFPPSSLEALGTHAGNSINLHPPLTATSLPTQLQLSISEFREDGLPSLYSVTQSDGSLTVVATDATHPFADTPTVNNIIIQQGQLVVTAASKNNYVLYPATSSIVSGEFGGHIVFANATHTRLLGGMAMPNHNDYYTIIDSDITLQGTLPGPITISATANPTSAKITVANIKNYGVGVVEPPSLHPISTEVEDYRPSIAASGNRQTDLLAHTAEFMPHVIHYDNRTDLGTFWSQLPGDAFIAGNGLQTLTGRLDPFTGLQDSDGDDIGTIYIGSLHATALVEVPVRTVKLDRYLVNSITVNTAGSNLVLTWQELNPRINRVVTFVAVFDSELNPIGTIQNINANSALTGDFRSSISGNITAVGYTASIGPFTAVDLRLINTQTNTLIGSLSPGVLEGGGLLFFARQLGIGFITPNDHNTVQVLAAAVSLNNVIQQLEFYDANLNFLGIAPLPNNIDETWPVNVYSLSTNFYIILFVREGVLHLAIRDRHSHHTLVDTPINGNELKKHLVHDSLSAKPQALYPKQPPLPTSNSRNPALSIPLSHLPSVHKQELSSFALIYGSSQDHTHGDIVISFVVEDADSNSAIYWQRIWSSSSFDISNIPVITIPTIDPVNPGLPNTTTIVPVATQTASATISISASSSKTTSATATLSITASISQTGSISLSVTSSTTPSPSPSTSRSKTRSATATFSITASISPTGSISLSITPSTTATPSPSPSTSRSKTTSATATLSLTASLSPSGSISLSITPTPFPTPSALADPSVSLQPDSSGGGNGNEDGKGGDSNLTFPIAVSAISAAIGATCCATLACMRRLETRNNAAPTARSVIVLPAFRDPAERPVSSLELSRLAPPSTAAIAQLIEQITAERNAQALDTLTRTIIQQISSLITQADESLNLQPMIDALNGVHARLRTLEGQPRVANDALHLATQRAALETLLTTLPRAGLIIEDRTTVSTPPTTQHIAQQMEGLATINDPQQLEQLRAEILQQVRLLVTQENNLNPEQLQPLVNALTSLHQRLQRVEQPTTDLHLATQRAALNALLEELPNVGLVVEQDPSTEHDATTFSLRVQPQERESTEDATEFYQPRLRLTAITATHRSESGLTERESGLTERDRDEVEALVTSRVAALLSPVLESENKRHKIERLRNARRSTISEDITPPSNSMHAATLVAAAAAVLDNRHIDHSSDDDIIEITYSASPVAMPANPPIPKTSARTLPQSHSSSPTPRPSMRLQNSTKRANVSQQPKAKNISSTDASKYISQQVINVLDHASENLGLALVFHHWSKTLVNTASAWWYGPEILRDHAWCKQMATAMDLLSEQLSQPNIELKQRQFKQLKKLLHKLRQSIHQLGSMHFSFQPEITNIKDLTDLVTAFRQARLAWQQQLQTSTSDFSHLNKPAKAELVLALQSIERELAIVWCRREYQQLQAIRDAYLQRHPFAKKIAVELEKHTLAELKAIIHSLAGNKNQRARATRALASIAVKLADIDWTLMHASDSSLSHADVLQSIQVNTLAAAPSLAEFIVHMGESNQQQFNSYYSKLATQQPLATPSAKTTPPPTAKKAKPAPVSMRYVIPLTFHAPPATTPTNYNSTLTGQHRPRGLG